MINKNVIVENCNNIETHSREKTSINDLLIQIHSITLRKIGTLKMVHPL